MPSTITILYGTVQTLTLTIASLANNTVNASAVIDNTSDLFDDILIVGKVQANSTGVNAAGWFEIAAHPSIDGGTAFAGTTATGAASGTTKRNSGWKSVARPKLNANSMVNEFSQSLAALFGGSLPPKLLVTIENQSGAALDSTSGNHYVKYIGVKYQSS